MTKEEQLSIINDAIKETKYNLKPLGYNFIFWGVLINLNDLLSLFFPTDSTIHLLFIYNLLDFNSFTWNGLYYLL